MKPSTIFYRKARQGNGDPLFTVVRPLQDAGSTTAQKLVFTLASIVALSLVIVYGF